jgi:hypothetical protein
MRMGWEKALELAKTRYPKEHHHVMRLWKLTWKASKTISIVAIVLLSAPAAVIVFLVGKQLTTTNIIMPPAPSTQPATAVAPALNIPSSKLPSTPAIRSPLEKLVASNTGLPSADKERLSNALFEFSRLLDQANKVFATIDIMGGELNRAYQNGDIGRDTGLYRSKLLAAQSLDKEFESSFSAQREKWKYYQDNFDYIFGPNPDGSMHLARNGIEDYLNYLDRWARIENKTEQPILQLLWHPQIRFDQFVIDFAHWRQESSTRFDREIAARQRAKERIGLYLRLVSQLRRLQQDAHFIGEYLGERVMRAQKDNTSRVEWTEILALSDDFGEVEMAWQNIELLPAVVFDDLDYLRQVLATIKAVGKHNEHTSGVEYIEARTYVLKCNRLVGRCSPIIHAIEGALKRIKPLD